ncbi:MAG: phosphopantetheine-binding protein [Cyanobacteria bacterium J06636_28]
MVLDKFPLTPSGKVDRRQLPLPVWLRSQTTHYIAPRTPLETEISQLWTELLGVQEIGIHDTFCSLGGHSLMAVQLIYRIKEHFGVELDLAKFLEDSTIAALADWVDQIQTQGQLETSEDTLATKASLDDTIQVPTLPESPIPNYFLTGATGFLEHIYPRATVINGIEFFCQSVKDKFSHPQPWLAQITDYWNNPVGIILIPQSVAL